VRAVRTTVFFKPLPLLVQQNETIGDEGCTTAAFEWAWCVLLGLAVGG
jgi:hypothetical protein